MFVPIVLAANAFLSAFAGTWSCTPHVPGVIAAPATTWTIGAVPKSSWARVTWSARGANGTAFVGYLPLQKQWIYDDYHSDGSTANYTAPAPVNNLWVWSGSYTTSARIVHGAAAWQRDKNGFRQGFGRLVGPSFRESAYAICRPARR